MQAVFSDIFKVIEGKCKKSKRESEKLANNNEENNLTKLSKR